MPRIKAHEKQIHLYDEKSKRSKVLLGNISVAFHISKSSALKREIDIPTKCPSAKMQCSLHLDQDWAKHCGSVFVRRKSVLYEGKPICRILQFKSESNPSSTER